MNFLSRSILAPLRRSRSRAIPGLISTSSSSPLRPNLIACSRLSGSSTRVTLGPFNTINFSTQNRLRSESQDLQASPSADLSPYEAKCLRLRREVDDLVGGSQILKKQVGGLEPPAKLDQLGDRFLHSIKKSILAARETNGEDWEQALYKALVQAAKNRIEGAQSKRGSGYRMTLRPQISSDDFRLAAAILKSKSSQPKSSDDLPSLITHEEFRIQRTKEDIEALLGGDDFLGQSIGRFPPIKLKSLTVWKALKRLVVTTLALLPYPKSRDGTFSSILCHTLEGVVLDRLKRQKRDGIRARFRRTTLIDLSTAEEMLHEQRINFIHQELSEFNFDQVSNELVEKVHGVSESEAQSSRFNPEPHEEAIRYRRRISELWKMKDWTSEYLFPHFPPITLRDPQTLLMLESIASITAAEEQGQYSGYPLIVKKAIRRAVLERVLDHDFRNRKQIRSKDQVLLEDVRRALELVKEWIKSNPNVRLK